MPTMLKYEFLSCNVAKIIHFSYNLGGAEKRHLHKVVPTAGDIRTDPNYCLTGPNLVIEANNWQNLLFFGRYRRFQCSTFLSNDIFK